MTRRRMVRWGIAVILLLAAIQGLDAQEISKEIMSPEYWAIWNGEIEAQIDAGIEKNRKSDAAVNLSEWPDGTVVHVRQITHDFKFGSNIFLFGQFDSEEKNRRYAEMFGDLFNAATIPFYWKTLEPTRGNLRFTEESEFIYRRPPTDPVVDFCVKRGIDIHGHAIIYGIRKWGHPDWLPNDRREMEPLFKDHIRRLAERYGGRIGEWDVVNESIHQADRGLMPDDYAFKTFEWAKEFFPADVRFSTNDCDFTWGPNRRYLEIVRDLIDRGAKVDLVGIQAHLFDPKQSAEIARGADLYSPQKIRDVLSTLAEADRPIHVSEITVSAPSDDDRGRQIQAVIVRNLYRLWFSDPRVARITWWNAVDGGAVPGEPSYSGVLSAELEKKPVYHELRRLIREEWMTDITAEVRGGQIRFRGFKGDYRLSRTDSDGRREIREFHLD